MDNDPKKRTLVSQIADEAAERNRALAFIKRLPKPDEYNKAVAALMLALLESKTGTTLGEERALTEAGAHVARWLSRIRKARHARNSNMVPPHERAHVKVETITKGEHDDRAREVEREQGNHRPGEEAEGSEDERG